MVRKGSSDDARRVRWLCSRLTGSARQCRAQQPLKAARPTWRRCTVLAVSERWLYCTEHSTMLCHVTGCSSWKGVRVGLPWRASAFLAFPRQRLYRPAHHPPPHPLYAVLLTTDLQIQEAAPFICVYSASVADSIDRRLATAPTHTHKTMSGLVLPGKAVASGSGSGSGGVQQPGADGKTAGGAESSLTNANGEQQQQAAIIPGVHGIVPTLQ